MAAPNIFKVLAGHGQSSITLDFSYLPLILCKWVGAPDNALIDNLYAVRNAHGMKGEPPWKLILVHDFSEMVAPSSTVRKYGADVQNSDPLLPNLKVLVISCVPNTILRGVMTAVVWMTGKENMPTEFSASLSDGIVRGLKVCEEWGLPIPPIDTGYKFPSDAPVWTQPKKR